MGKYLSLSSKCGVDSAARHGNKLAVNAEGNFASERVFEGR